MRRSSWAVPIDMSATLPNRPRSHATSFRSDQTIEPIRTSIGDQVDKIAKEITVLTLGPPAMGQVIIARKATFTTFLLLNTWCAVRAILGRHPDTAYSVNNSTVKPGGGYFAVY